MLTCSLCLNDAPDAPIQMLCLRAGCTVQMIACAPCCKARENFGKDHLGYVRSLLEVRHCAAEHPSRSEARS